MMSSRAVIVGALALGCLSAAGVGGYLAVRTATESSMAAGQVAGEAGARAAETRAPAEVSVAGTRSPNLESRDEPTRERVVRADNSSVTRRPAAAGRPREAARTPAAAATLPMAERAAPIEIEAPVVPAEVALSTPPAARPASAPVAPTAVLEELIVPAESVIGIRLDSGLSSETARVEDRVTARVTRDVRVDGVTVIPAGARMDGFVTFVEQGGKIRERARIGIRFTSVARGDSGRVPIQTETIYRDGDAPGGEATSKIGASAVVGSILGAVIGGKKGAAIGAGAGAAGGTAVVMAGGRNEAVFAAGVPLTVRLSAPVTLEIERER